MTYQRVFQGVAFFALLFSMSLSFPVLAQEAAPEQSATVEAATVYLAPLEAQRADKDAYIETLESMGDREVMRLGVLLELLRSGTAETPEQATAYQLEMKECLQKLSWLCESGLRNYAEDARVRNFRGNILYDNFGKQVEGVKEWHTAISLDSKYSHPYNNLGMHYFHVGRYPLGFQNMDKALELEPKNPDFLFNMAQNYLIFSPEVEKHRGWPKKKVYKEAMKLSSRAVKEDPEDYQLLEDYAVNYLAAENFGIKADWKDAAKAWQAAREYAPSPVKVFYTWLNEGRMWKRAGRDKDALRCFEEAQKIIPNNEVVQRLIDGLDEDA